jgi:peroxiredoxin/tetratricopeptide (TPR) repeat protein
MGSRGYLLLIALTAPLAVATSAHAKLSKGDPAPPFELASVGGGSVSSQTLAQGGLAVLTFISLDSKPSRELAINLEGLAKDHAKEGLTVVAVAADGADKLKTFASEQALTYSVCADPSKETVKRYGAENVVPITYLIAPGGTIAEVVPGGGAGVQHVLMAVAEKEFARGNPSSASRLYEQVSKEDPKNVGARAGLGFALAKEGKLERAEEEFKTLESSGPEGAGLASEGLAEVKLRKGDLDGALTQIARVPSDASYGHVIRGEVAARRGNLGEAANQFEAATAAKRSTFAWQKGVAFNNLANVSGQKGDAASALKSYDKAIGAEPFLVEARSNKGATLQKTGRLDEAKKTLASARAIAPSDELVATLLRRVEQQEKAKLDLEREKLENQLVNELVEAFRKGKAAPPAADDWSPRALVVSFLDFKNRLGPLAREGLDEAFLLNLTQRLQESGRIKVVEREIIDKLLSELKLGSSELADPATRLKLGRVLAASVIGTGGFYPNEAKSELQLRLIDAETTDIRSTLADNLSDPAQIGTFADRVADKIAKTLRSDYPLKGKIASVDGDEIIVGVGRKHGAQQGLRFRVVEDGEAVTVDGEVVGHKQKTVGMLEVTKVEDGFAYAKPLDGGSFRKGQHLIEASQ